MISARVIKPSKPFQSSIFREEMKKAAETIRKDALADFKKTTANWKHKPKFASKITLGQGEITVQVATDDAVYGYVDKGTRPHIIRAKTKRGLLFKGRIRKSKPKTIPNVVGSFPGTPGEGWIRKNSVRHPGTKARNFTKHIAKTTKTELQRETKNALARFARRSGHSIAK